jgi:hypothetical protein
MSILQKFLAQVGRQPQGRFAMRRTLAGSGLLIALFCAVALSVSPQLHERVHPDANRADHTCVVTIFASGSCEHATAAPIAIDAPAPCGTDFLPERLSIFTAPVESSILEHAPPANS